ncbi:MAG: exodeoxyribonuclease VII small subunit [Treponema sp.]|nr:exodeoxyribonuclease VII small subunit [Treponema sp.]
MAKKTQSIEAKKTFEERLERLEELGDEIRKNDIPLDNAIKAFEEGIKLARDLEKDLGKIESRIEILMNGTETPDDAEADAADLGARAKAREKPVFGLFDEEE